MKLDVTKDTTTVDRNGRLAIVKAARRFHPFPPFGVRTTKENAT